MRIYPLRKTKEARFEVELDFYDVFFVCVWA
jgi:hypothetical protein